MFLYKAEQSLDNNLKYLNFTKAMSVAALEALKSNPNPNPKVGAALFDKNMKLKYKSHHVKKGEDHAEIDLIKKSNIQDTDYLYITLEPCFHDDTSPSCAKELLKTDIKNIVIGDIDSDPRTCGKSINYLKNNKINVSIENGVNDFLNPGYKVKNNKPYLIGKVATSADHIIYNEKKKYITNKNSLEITHYLRATVDSVIIGKNTLKIDKPKLNVRLDYEYKNPQPIVLWGNDTKELKKYSSLFNNFIFYVENDEDSFSNFLERHSIKSGLVEGGNSILSYFLYEDMIDEFYYFKSSDSLESGLKIDKTIEEYISNNFNSIQKYPIIDNLLTTYTNK